LVSVGWVMTIAPLSCARIASTSSGVLPPMNTGEASSSAPVAADHPSA
jgi:hypothetical protein